LVGKERKIGIQFSSKGFRNLGRVDTYCHDIDFTCRDALIKPTELPELRHAERSPVPAVEEIKDRLPPGPLPGRERLSPGIG
jgi:hypothetical protein